VTADEWESISDVQSLLNCSESARSDRKLRLFCLACCQPILGYLDQPMSRAAIEFLERSVDIETELWPGIPAVRNEAKLAHNYLHIVMLQENEPAERERSLVRSLAAEAAHEVLDDDATWAAASTSSLVGRVIGKQFGEKHADLLREILGNPFRTVEFDPDWRTSNVVSMARGMYRTNDFAAMPILGDALQDAGCEETEILDHCRSAPHVKGCWLIDRILGWE